MTIRRGSNQLRDELRSFVSRVCLGLVWHFGPRQVVSGQPSTLAVASSTNQCFAGPAGQPSYSGLLLRHFEEKRDDKVSLDRVGASSFDPAVVRYLVVRATADGKKFNKPKSFDGWAVAYGQSVGAVSFGPEAASHCVAKIVGPGRPDNSTMHMWSGPKVHPTIRWRCILNMCSQRMAG